MHEKNLWMSSTDFCCQAIQSITRPRNNMSHYHSDTCKTPWRRERGEKKKERTKREIKRHVGQGTPAHVLLQRERERERGRGRERERERERETQGAGPTRCSSSQLHSREVTMASDKQSTIDHSSPRRSPALEAAEGRAVRQRERKRERERESRRSRQRQKTTESSPPICICPSAILWCYILTPFLQLECH